MHVYLDVRRYISMYYKVVAAGSMGECELFF
jgi:hypothetical protein